MDAIDWNQTVEDLGPRLYRYFSGRFDASTATDLVQETLLRLVKGSRSGIFDPQKGSLAQFGFGIAHRVGLEEYKRSAKVLNIEKQVKEIPKDDSTSLVGQIEELRSAILELTEIQQEVVLLSIDRELKQEEIAEVLDIPLNTVKSHIRRAKERLKEILVSQPQEESHDRS